MEMDEPATRTAKQSPVQSIIDRFWRLLEPARRRLPLRSTTVPKMRMPAPGSEPGAIDQRRAEEAATAGPLQIVCIDYSPDQLQVEEVQDVNDFLARHRPLWSRVRWISVIGLGPQEVIHAIAEKYQIHPLAVEDTVTKSQRPKAEDYPGSGDLPGRLFVVSRQVEMHDNHMENHQVNFFLGRTTLITIQDSRVEVFDPIRQRLESPGSRLRVSGADFLLYALLDAIVDDDFPLLERFSERLENVEEEMLTRASQSTLHEVHVIKRQLLLIRRTAWPMRELIAQLQRDKHECLSETTQTYFRDVYDHCVQVIDLVETYREITGTLTETYMSTISNRTNDVMKVLTVIGTIFLPLTFLAGVYGMNMTIPEMEWKGLYAAFWAVCIVMAGSMILWFRRRGWL